ncbi:MAG: undecaprenyldiphospho-muramoylpentapeptide beta-N-acetylglucosaminyltransferase [Clostridia bacterium]|nr:undecaprenyldiphospho-muramoylpentapeptide beta-N-acetylglucosaminyltransferase [Clostridia bacterium]
MKVLFAGGGTGGHINPALSVADYLRKRNPGFEALFVGTKRGLETKLVPAAGYDIKYIDIKGFDRKNLLNNFSVVAKLIKANSDSVKIIKEFKPDCVVLTGGYVSGPVAMAAKKCGVPALIHEQNVYPGLTVSGSSKYVDYLAVSFDETVTHLKNNPKCVVTGNPIREEILLSDKQKSREKLGISEDERFVLVFGGSLGSEMINNAMLGVIPSLKDTNIRLLFGTGERNYKEFMEKVGETPENVTITPYINNMQEVMAASDLAVTRAGAITVSELACLNKPAILIPSPNVVRNHQEQNASEFMEKGAAVMLKETDLNSENLKNIIISLANDDKELESMAKNMEFFAKRDALERIEELVIKMTSK